MTYQEILDTLIEEQNYILHDKDGYWQTIPIPIKYKLLKIIGAVAALASIGRIKEGI